MAGDAVGAVFARSEPHVGKLAQALIARMAGWPGFRTEAKANSVHLCGKSAFAGLHPRKGALLLNIRSAAPIESGRVRKRERVSAHRFHNEMLLDSAAALDEELLGWLADAHALASG